MKEEAGNFIPLDPEKIYPISGKLSQSKSVSKLSLVNQQDKERSRIEAAIKKNRPQPLVNEKVRNFRKKSPSGLRSSLTQIKSSVVSPLPKASKSQGKFFSKRSSSKKRKILRNKLF